jgi:hypothetical protein
MLPRTNKTGRIGKPDTRMGMSVLVKTILHLSAPQRQSLSNGTDLPGRLRYLTAPTVAYRLVRLSTLRPARAATSSRQKSRMSGFTRP